MTAVCLKRGRCLRMRENDGVVLLPDSGFSFARRDGVGNVELCACQFACVLGHSLLHFRELPVLRRDLLSHSGQGTARPS